jgi:hypothetical protein
VLSLTLPFTIKHTSTLACQYIDGLLVIFGCGTSVWAIQWHIDTTNHEWRKLHDYPVSIYAPLSTIKSILIT